MSDIVDITSAVARAIRAGTGWTVLENPADSLPMAANRPTCMILWTQTDYDETFQGASDRFQFVVRVFAGRVSEKLSIQRLYEATGRADSGLKTVIEDDEQLNAEWSVRVVKSGNLGVRDFGEAQYLSVDVFIEVQT